jgi:hypothetical protein
MVVVLLGGFRLRAGQGKRTASGETFSSETPPWTACPAHQCRERFRPREVGRVLLIVSGSPAALSVKANCDPRDSG